MKLQRLDLAKALKRLATLCMFALIVEIRLIWLFDEACDSLYLTADYWKLYVIFLQVMICLWLPNTNTKTVTKPCLEAFYLSRNYLYASDENGWNLENDHHIDCHLPYNLLKLCNPRVDSLYYYWILQAEGHSRFSHFILKN